MDNVRNCESHVDIRSGNGMYAHPDAHSGELKMHDLPSRDLEKY